VGRIDGSLGCLEPRCWLGAAWRAQQKIGGIGMGRGRQSYAHRLAGFEGLGCNSFGNLWNLLNLFGEKPDLYWGLSFLSYRAPVIEGSWGGILC
jgi:hypothetical protein